MAHVPRLKLPVAVLVGLLAAEVPVAAGPTPAAPAVSPSKVLASMAAPDRPRGGGVVPPARGPIEPNGDRTLAPYFAVAGGDGETERLPLEQTSADVAIVGVIARVTVSQHYVNRGKKPIEAVYVFPASTRAAVHGMRMKIGTRVLEARIERRQQARAAYESARQHGRRASLLEQERPNVFTMNVANVMPGDRIAVELEYSELLVPEEGVYEFVYPTVVGPRYGGGADPARDRWIANPYLTEGTATVSGFTLSARVDAGMDLKELSSPSHAVDVSYESPRRARVSLRGTGNGNRDFLLRYRLAGDQIETGVLLFENYFAVLLEPPPRPTADQVPPREFIFLLDVSGSMNGFPLETAKELMRKLFSSLRPIDSFNVVLFSGTSYTLSAEGSLPATRENVARALEVVERQRGGGGTELLAGLQAAYGIPRPRNQVARTVVAVTDGFVGVEPQTFRFVRERLNEANLFAFGIGSSVNRGLIEGMARAGQGEPFVVLSPDKAAQAADRLRLYIEQPVLTGVQVKWNGFAAEEVAPAQLPDLLARRPLVLLGKYSGPASGRIEISGWQGKQGGRFHRTLQVRPEDVRQENAPLRWLWARKWVELLDDERHMAGGQEAEGAITALGLGHKLLTAFTSFVAVDSERVNAGGPGETVKQPLPLPEGVSSMAVGSAVGGLALQGFRAQAVVGGQAKGRGYGAVGGLPIAPAAVEPLSRAESEHDLADEVRKAKVPVTVTVTAVAGTSAGEALALQVKQALTSGPFRAARARSGCALPAAWSVVLRLTMDRKGKVLGVSPAPSGGGELPSCLVQLLVGLRSQTRATGGATGTVDLRIMMSPAR